MSTDFPNPHADDDALDLSPDALAELSAFLDDASLWEETDPADEAAILAAIGELAMADSAPAVPFAVVADVVVADVVVADAAVSSRGEADSNVVSISTARRWLGPFAAGIAAALALVIGVSVLTADSDREGVELALAGTDLAPDAEGVVEIVDTPNGTVLLLDVSGLPPAPEGSYYEAWVRKDAQVGVSAGTFHLRGGGGDVELWAGVTTADYPLFTVTIQDEADPVSSGRVVLKGLLGE